jgi:mRNA interferase RelE/StbE
VKVVFTKQFDKEIEKLKDEKLASRIEEVIATVKEETVLLDIPNIKKLAGHKNAYRIRVGDYRIGIFVSDDNVVAFSRFLHRKEIYRYFP